MLGAELQFPTICYGTMWQFGLNTEVAITTTGVFELIPDMSNGDDYGFDFQNTQELVCTEPGKYRATWNICFTNGNNTTWTAGVGVNGTVQDNTKGCRKLGALDTGSIPGGGVVTLVEGDIVTLEMANETTTSNAFITSANLTLSRVDE